MATWRTCVRVGRRIYVHNSVLLVQHDEDNFFIQDLSETTIMPGLLALFHIILVLLTLITISFRSTLR